MNRLSLFFLFACLGIVSCEKASPEKVAATNPEEIKLTKAESAVRDVSNVFGVEVFKELNSSNTSENVVFSPLSLSLSLAMAAEGAQGATYDQFANVVGWKEMDRGSVSSFYRTLTNGLAKVDNVVRFSDAASVWYVNSAKPRAEYVVRLKEGYAAESFAVEDFGSAATVERINTWCKDKTDGKITAIFPSLDRNTKMLLIDAMFFEGPWSFDSVKDGKSTFHGVNGDSRKNYMSATAVLPYREFPEYECLILPYGNYSYEMHILLPKTGKTITDVLNAMNGKYVPVYDTREAKLRLPMFSSEFSSEESLKKALVKMGLTLPFSPEADFSGIANNVYISNVTQRNRIEVTERGASTESVSVVIMGDTGPYRAPGKIDFVVDKPFVYAIFERTSGTLLLLGTYNK